MNNLEIWSAENFYKRLDYFLDKKNWSIHRLSMSTDTSAASLYEMRRKRFFPRFKTLCMICDALDISLYEFFFLSENLSDEAYSILSDIEKVPIAGQNVLIELIKLLTKNS